MIKRIAKMAVIFMCATMCAACANAKTVKGSKKMVRMTYNLSGFQAVDAEGQVSVTVKTGTEFSVTATVPDNVKDYFIFTVKDNTLKISNRKMSFSSAGKDYSPSVTVTLPVLISIDASDQSALSFSGNVAANFAVSTSGQSSVRYSGTLNVTNIAIETSDQSSLNISELNATNAAVNSEGQSSIRFSVFNVKNGLTMSSSGQSSIRGNKLNCKGKGTLKAEDQSSINFTAAAGNVNWSKSGQASCSLGR